MSTNEPAPDDVAIEIPIDCVEHIRLNRFTFTQFLAVILTAQEVVAHAEQGIADSELWRLLRKLQLATSPLDGYISCDQVATIDGGASL